MNFDWTDDYLLHIEPIDREHRRFLSLIKSYHNSSSTSEDLVLKDLSRYIEFHFESEERLMELEAYSKLNEHKLAHLELRKKFLSYQQQRKMGNLKKSELLYFLLSWFVQHTTEVDKDFTKEVTSKKY